MSYSDRQPDCKALALEPIFRQVTANAGALPRKAVISWLS